MRIELVNGLYFCVDTFAVGYSNCIWNRGLIALLQGSLAVCHGAYWENYIWDIILEDSGILLVIIALTT